jgi:DNA-binding NarL/FixJ family response regulator
MILDALRHVLRGEIYLSPTMATRLLQCAAIGEPLDRDPCHVLSEREIQILELVGRGLTTSQIARQLELSPKTVESHRKQLKDKLNLHNGAQLNRFAFHWRAEHR